MNTFTTPKGTVLPLLNLKDKQYLQVQHRVLWFREENPGWSITTSIINDCPFGIVLKATVTTETGQVIASAHKTSASPKFPLEMAETGAIGRALALCGYGTAHSDDFDDSQEIADSPMPHVDTKKVGKPWL